MVDFNKLRVNLKINQELQVLYDDINTCTACPARQEASSPVPGIGANTGIVVIGRNPGRDEDLRGSPFTGPSGRVLNAWLEVAGLDRHDIHLTNLILCHTMGDRKPEPIEIKTCVSLHLIKLLAIMKPYLVITLGAEATAAFLGKGTKIAKVNGTVYPYKSDFWVIPSLHPGSILYEPRQQANLNYSATQVRRFLANKEEYKQRLMK